MPSTSYLNTAADPTDDAPAHEIELTQLLTRQMAQGVSHRAVMWALLDNFVALARVYPCCTDAAARAALGMGGRLLVASIERPANTTTH